MLDACHALLDDGVLFTSHVNESPGEIDFVRELFPDGARLPRHLRARRPAERLLGAGAQRPRLRRRAATPRGVADRRRALPVLATPSWPPGIFPMARHVEHGVRFGMGTDVGAGTGLSMLKEGLVAYHVQMVRDQGHMLGPAHLLWLATAAGARALDSATPAATCGRARRPTSCCCDRAAGSTLEAVLEEAPDWNAALGAVFTLAREESVVGDPRGRRGRVRARGCSESRESRQRERCAPRSRARGRAACDLRDQGRARRRASPSRRDRDDEAGGRRERRRARTPWATSRGAPPRLTPGRSSPGGRPLRPRAAAPSAPRRTSSPMTRRSSPAE